MNALRLVMWSGPCNVSTAFIRSRENRRDTLVVDEPFYAHYLKVTGRDHPGREEVIEHHESDWRRVVDSLLAPLPQMGREWLGVVTHAFRLRDPWPVLGALCAALGVPFTQRMLFSPPRRRGSPRSKPSAVRCTSACTPTDCAREERMQQRFNERNRDLIVNISGRLVHRDEAGVSPFDSVVQGGDAVWEGLRLYQGRIFRLEQHLDRLVHSAKALAFAQIPAPEHIITEIRRTLAANGMFDGVHVRLTLTRGVKVTSGMDPRLNQSGPTLIVLAEHKAPVYGSGGLALVTSSVRRFPPDCLDPKIHHNNLIQSILAKIEANVAGADDAVMLDMRGFVAETNATNLFIVEQSRVRTPRTVACPEGITRGAVLDLCRANGIPFEECDLPLSEFYRADEAFCTGTMGELAAVTQVDGRVIGAGTPGPLTGRLSQLFRELTEREGYPVVGP